MDKIPIDIPGVRNITVSGRIGSGATTLARKLAEELSWEALDGGSLFRKINKDLGITVVETNKRPDHFDLEYEERIKKMLREEKHQIIQSHLAGFDAQGIPNIFKIIVLCENQNGHDKTEVRIDRLVNRDNISVKDARREIVEREKQNLQKFRRLYVNNDPAWIYWDKKYYDLVINTYQLNSEESLRAALKALGI